MKVTSHNTMGWLPTTIHFVAGDLRAFYPTWI